MAKKDVKTTAEQSTENEALMDAAEAETPGKKTVKIKLFKDDGKYKDDVFVCINGKSYGVKRGEWVDVPEAVAKVIEAMEKQDNKTANLMQREQDKYLEEVKSRNI